MQKFRESESNGILKSKKIRKNIFQDNKNYMFPPNQRKSGNRMCMLFYPGEFGLLKNTDLKNGQ